MKKVKKYFLRRNFKFDHKTFYVWLLIVPFISSIIKDYVSCIEKIAYCHQFISKEQMLTLLEPIQKKEYDQFEVKVA